MMSQNPHFVHQSKKASAFKPGVFSIVQMFAITGYLMFLFFVELALGRITIQRTDQYLHRWGKHLLNVTHTSIVIENPQNLQLEIPCIYMSNHTSLLDIIVLLYVLPPSVRMVAKQELAAIPVFGKALIHSGFIPINRGNVQNAIEQLEVAKKRVHEGISICIFPEGTRSSDAKLLPFKKGGFHLAIDLGIPIVPVWLEGAQKAIPPRALKVNHNHILTVRIGTPIPTVGLDKSNLPSLMEETRKELLKLS